jgi:ribosome-binding protein aMBF1 (putative translation factor)
LLACEQRKSTISRNDTPVNRRHRKTIPTVINMPGDYIKAKRYEKGIPLHQIAAKMGIAAILVSAWEKGTSEPSDKQWQALSHLLKFDSEVQFQKPHR